MNADRTVVWVAVLVMLGFVLATTILVGGMVAVSIADRHSRVDRVREQVHGCLSIEDAASRGACIGGTGK